ncbi:MAG: hypothetical protein IJH12_10395 [Clostridia bacterium]|nr:hypothetical protein [Clostridia bacterium]
MGKKRSLIITLLLVIIMICCSGCSKDTNNEYNDIENVNQSVEYSENIQKIRSMVIEGVSDKSVGEILDDILMDYSWSEYQNYLSKTAKGCVQVSGKDKKSGEDVSIIWGIEMANPSEENHFEKMSKGREAFLDYEYFKTYISNRN